MFPQRTSEWIICTVSKLIQWKDLNLFKVYGWCVSYGYWQIIIASYMYYSSWIFYTFIPGCCVLINEEHSVSTQWNLLKPYIVPATLSSLVVIIINKTRSVSTQWNLLKVYVIVKIQRKTIYAITQQLII